LSTDSTAILNIANWALLPFEKVDSLNPILLPGTSTFTCPILNKVVRWDEKDVFNPAAVVHKGKVYMIFRAEDTIGKYAGTSRLGLATSDDGLHFTRLPAPVFFPDNDSLKRFEWEGGVEDPRIVKSERGEYIMTYTGYDGTTARLLVASSKDLMTWTKHGTVLQGKYKNTWSKSGAIVAALRDTAQLANSHTTGLPASGQAVVAARINGKYWMYFGDTDLFMATSDDLLHWTPVEEGGRLKSVLKPRPGYFDSRLVESGPFALLTDRGVTLIYNGMNLDTGGDTTLAPGAYCSGQALFDKNDPTVAIDRLNEHFLKPDRPYELAGQVNQVCFVEGLVPFRGQWFLYYGTADSKIAVAVKP
ncbi:MAG TPA: glycoside hydrolase family 130 protein, partial [Chryseolinea sp.]|nr:glycoside hydrolase family 130 protein [Chryseolinea sp.]